jgi:hypothetical protein
MLLATLAVAAVLHGSVTVGPVTPVCRVGTPCDKPASRVTLTFTHGTQVFKARTDTHGLYTVTLPPGTYAVKASTGMRIAPSQVTARAGRHLRSFSIDTGIR